MATKAWAVAIVIFGAVLASIAQVLWKFGALGFPETKALVQIFIGFVLYGTFAVMFVYANKAGELSTLYPILATSYIWVSLLAMYFFNETMSLLKWAGIAAVIIGVAFVGIGSTKEVTA